MRRAPVEIRCQATRGLAAATLVLLLGACATPPEPKPTTPPEPPPPPPSTVEVEPLKRQPPPEPVAGGPQQGEQQSKGELETQQEDSEASASSAAAVGEAPETAGQSDGAQAANDMAKTQNASAPSAAGASAADTLDSGGASGQSPNLDGQLEQELSKFDEALLADQKSLAMRREQAHAGGGTGMSGEGNWPQGYGDGGEDSGAVGSAGEAGDREEGEAQGQRGGIARTSERRADGTPVEAVPDGRDDDIVARQLREAAERETDPELKAKLWQEYRDYKKSVSRQAGS